MKPVIFTYGYLVPEIVPLTLETVCCKTNRKRIKFESHIDFSFFLPLNHQKYSVRLNSVYCLQIIH